MKLKKLILLTPMLISLAACNGGETSYAGTYSFQLGSDSGTHAGIHLTLTDEVVPDMEIEAKKFSIQFDVSGGAGAGILGSLGHIDDILKAINSGEKIDIDDLEETYTDVKDTAIDIIKDETEDKPITIDGYYYTKEVEKETRLMMGISLDAYDIDISDEIVEKVMFATITTEQVNVVIPVSIKDFLYQLYWYGYRVAGIDSLLEPVSLPNENPFMHYNEVGTHPTAEDVEEIQKYQKKRQEDKPDGYELGEFIYNDYFNYHTLSMGLAKDGKK